MKEKTYQLFSAINENQFNLVHVHNYFTHA